VEGDTVKPVAVTDVADSGRLAGILPSPRLLECLFDIDNPMTGW
jgi:hypothetical protein